MVANKPVWGIDLGQCALKGICLRAAGEKIEVVNHVYIEHSKILSQPDADRQALISGAMKEFAQQQDLSKAILVVSVPGQNTLARFIKLPPVDKKKIPEIVKYEARQQIPSDMEEVIWDYQVFQQPEAMETEVGIFATRREMLRNHLHCFSSLNLEPAAVQSAPLALYNALKFDDKWGDEAVTILDIGAQNTDLIVADGDSLWTRNIPIGGNNFTEALLKTFKLSFNKAEKLKREAQKHKYARQIFQAMRPVFADLVAEIQRSIGFFSSSRRGTKLGRIIAMGNAFKLPGMVKFLQQNLGMEVVRPTTFRKLSTSDAPNAPQLIDHLLSLGVAYGLALQGLGLAPITSNLLPPEIAQQVIWRKKTPWFYAAAACLLLSAGIVWAVNFSDSRAVQAASGDTNTVRLPVTDFKQASRIINEGPRPDLSPVAYAEAIVDAGKVMGTALSEVSGENEQKIREAEEIARLRSSKAVWPNILDMVHSALPPFDEKQLAEALAKGPEAYDALIKSDKLLATLAKGPNEYSALIKSDADTYARGKRKQIFVQELRSEYCSDVVAEYLQTMKQAGRPSSSRSRQAPRGMLAAPEAVGPLKAGFLVHLVIQTPYEGSHAFVEGEFLSKLRGAQRDGVYVHDCDFISREQVGGGDGRRGSGDFGLPRHGARHAREGTRRLGSAGLGDIPVLSLDTEGRDPVTGEPIESDWEFEIVLAVVLGAKSEEEAPPGGQAPTPWE